MWDLVPQQGLNPCHLHWKHRVLTTGPPGKSQVHVVFFCTCSFKSFYLKIIIDSQEVADSTERSQVFITQLPLIVSFFLVYQSL